MDSCIGRRPPTQPAWRHDQERSLGVGRPVLLIMEDPFRNETMLGPHNLGPHIANSECAVKIENPFPYDVQVVPIPFVTGGQSIKHRFEGVIKNKISEKEFKSYSWDEYEKGDPSFLFELLPGIATQFPCSIKRSHAGNLALWEI